jgi:hypothetical protein
LWEDSENTASYVVFYVKPSVAIKNIFEPVHEIEGIFIVIIDLIARSNVQEHIGQSSIHPACIEIIIDVSQWGYLEIIADAKG